MTSCFMMRTYVDDDKLGRLVPNFPRAAIRYGVKFPTHEAAATFIQQIRQWPLTCDRK